MSLCLGDTTGACANESHLDTDNTTLNGLEIIYHGEIWTPAVIQRTVTLAVIMTLTLVGNITIIVVLSCSKYRKLNSRVNIFIVNLAIGDLTVCCFTMTTEVFFCVFEGAWILGAAACKILVYIQIITLASTTFLLTAMSYDRYMAICKPLSFGNTSSRARKFIAISWTLALIFASPQLFIFRQDAVGIYPDEEIKYKCRSRGYTAWWQRKLYFTFMACYILVLPAILISFYYINVVAVVWKQGKECNDSSAPLRKSVKDKNAVPRAKVKTIKMTLAIIGSFIICWTPYFVSHLIHIWSEYKIDIPETVNAFAETIALLNSALNPILYGCFNIKLKRGLFEVFCPHRLKQNANQTNRTQCRGGNTGCAQLRDTHACSDMAKHLGTQCVNPTGSSSSSSGAAVEHHKDGKNPRAKDNIIKEENKNGFRLRVRFTGGNRSPSPQKGLLKGLLSDQKENMDSETYQKETVDTETPEETLTSL